MPRRHQAKDTFSHSRGAEPDVVQLQELAVARAERLGHVVGPWRPVDERDSQSWVANCEQCGAVAYVRREHGLLGIAGALCTDPCSKTPATPA